MLCVSFAIVSFRMLTAIAYTTRSASDRRRSSVSGLQLADGEHASIGDVINWQSNAIMPPEKIELFMVIAWKKYIISYNESWKFTYCQHCYMYTTLHLMEHKKVSVKDTDNISITFLLLVFCSIISHRLFRVHTQLQISTWYLVAFIVSIKLIIFIIVLKLFQFYKAF